MTSDRNTRVLVLVPTLAIGGAEMDLVRNLPRINKNRFEIIVCAFLARGDLAKRLEDAGVEIIGPISVFAWLSAATRCLPARARLFCRRALGLAWNLLPARLQSSIRTILTIPFAFLIGMEVAKLIRRHKIRVVHTILPNAYLVGFAAVLFARHCGLVMSRVSLNWYQKQNPLLGVIERRVLHRSVNAVICNSMAIQSDLLQEGLSWSKIRLIPNGIDPESFPTLGNSREQAREQLEIPQSVLVLSVVASLYAYKGYGDLLHALALVRDRLPCGWRLIAAGRDVNGNLGMMRRLANELGLANHVWFLGERNDIARILRAADMHVSASHTEGFPNNILEAMFASLPVIATKVGGVPEMVVDGQTGLLVPSHNPDELAGALLRLGHDAKLRHRMGEAGRWFVEEAFSLKSSVNAFEEVYTAIAAQRRTAGAIVATQKAASGSPPPRIELGSASPRVSVVMPVYNDLRFLDEAVSSVLVQSFQNFELIVIDDATGQDAVFARLAERDSRIRIITNKANLGTAAAANRGVASARANIIAPLDADDIAEPTRLEQLVAALDADPALGLVGSWFTTIDEAGARRELVRTPECDLKVRWTNLFCNPFCHSSVAYRRNIFEAANGYEADQPILADQYLWSRMLPICRVRNIPDALVRYRINPRGLTATSTHDWRPRARQMRQAAWASLEARYDVDDDAYEFALAQFVSGYDIECIENRSRAHRTILTLLRRFLANLRPFTREDDAIAAEQLMETTVARILADRRAGVSEMLRIFCLASLLDRNTTASAFNARIKHEFGRSGKWRLRTNSGSQPHLFWNLPPK